MRTPWFVLLGKDGVVYEEGPIKEYLEQCIARGYTQDGYDGIGPLRTRLPNGCEIKEVTDQVEQAINDLEGVE